MSDAETRRLVFEQEMPHPPEKVWRALTESALLDEWLMHNDFQPVVGHHFNFRREPTPTWNGVVDCEVLEVEHGQRLSYRWDSSGEEAGNMRTVVTWTLTPTERGTLIRLEQAGFPPEGAGAYYQGASYGWPRFLGALEQVLSGLK